MRFKVIALYSAAAPVSIALCFWLTTMVFNATQNWQWRRLPDWTILAINILPPMTAGVLISLASLWFARRQGWYEPTLRAHAMRLALTYALSIAIIALIIANWSNSDFGLWGQLIEWPLAALIGLALVDLVATIAAGRHRVAATYDR